MNPLKKLLKGSFLFKILSITKEVGAVFWIDPTKCIDQLPPKSSFILTDFKGFVILQSRNCDFAIYSLSVILHFRTTRKGL